MTRREAYDHFYKEAHDFVLKRWPDCHGEQLDNRIAGVIDEMQAQAERIENNPDTLTRVDVYDVDMHVTTMCYIKRSGDAFVAVYNKKPDLTEDVRYSSRDELEAAIRKTLAFTVIKKYIGAYICIHLR